jgi:hypothetical protein
VRSDPKDGANRASSDAPAPVSDHRDDGAQPLPPARVTREPRDPRDVEKPRSERPSGSRIEIELEVARSRSIGWTIFGLLVGGLLIWKLGTVGVWVGVALVATGAYHAWNLLQTFLHPPGMIVISDREVSLPRGLCMSRPVLAKPSDITAVYFLRRSVPWNRASPVLVIELGPKAMLFPRDWFGSEADQRRIIHALLRDKLGAGAAKPAGDDKAI